MNEKPTNGLSDFDLVRLIGLLELFWPLPLLIAGISGSLNPAFLSLAVVAALAPWPLRWLITGTISRPPIIGWPLALLALAACLSLWSSHNLHASLPLVITLLACAGLFFALINSSLKPHTLAGTLVGIGLLFAFYFVTQYAHNNYPSVDERWQGAIDKLAVTTSAVWPNLALFSPHLNATAAFLEGLILLSLLLIWQARRAARLFWGGTTALLLYAVLITTSRGAWLGIGVALLLWITVYAIKRFRRDRLAVLLFGALLIGVVGTVMFLAGSRSSLVRGTESVAGSRLEIYRNSLFLVGDYPFTGIGLGETFAMIYSRYQLLIQVPFLTHTHNLYLTVALGTGLSGLIALLWLLFNFYRFALTLEFGRIRFVDKAVFRTAWLGTTAIFIHGLMDAPQFSYAPWTMPMLFALLGLTVAAGQPGIVKLEEMKDEPLQLWSVRRWAPVLLIGGIVLIAVILLRWPLLGAWYANLGAVYQTQADLAPTLDEAERSMAQQRAIDYYNQALVYHPEQPTGHRRLGLMLSEKQQFEAAQTHLEQAYQQEPTNQATIKALGLVYTWNGQLDLAAALLPKVNDRLELIEELRNWENWWRSQNREDLAENAGLARQAVVNSFQ